MRKPQLSEPGNEPRPDIQGLRSRRFLFPPVFFKGLPFIGILVCFAWVLLWADMGIAEGMEQALALPENMENKELNARLREIAEERESILHQLGSLRQADERQAGQAARMNSLREFVEQRETKFAVYDDAITRKFVEQITVLNAETIRMKFRYPGLEVNKKLN